MREYLRQILTIDSHEVTAVCNGQEALDAWEPEIFDVVLTDRSMPELNGDQLAAAIREQASEQSIIMVTGFGHLMSATDDSPEHVDMILSKPCTRSDLRAALARTHGEGITHSTGDSL